MSGSSSSPGSVATASPHEVVGRLAVHRHAELLATIRRRYGTQVEAEEVLQAAFERALAHADQLRDPSHAEAWLRTIIRHVALNQLQQSRRADLRDELEPANPDEDVGNACDCVVAQLERLKPSYAVILRRSVVEGAPVGALAKDLGLTPNNAAVRLHRARLALKKQLEEHCGTTSVRSCNDCGCNERRCC